MLIDLYMLYVSIRVRVKRYKNIDHYYDCTCSIHLYYQSHFVLKIYYTALRTKSSSYIFFILMVQKKLNFYIKLLSGLLSAVNFNRNLVFCLIIKVISTYYHILRK